MHYFSFQEVPKELHLRLIAVDGDRERTFEVRIYMRDPYSMQLRLRVK